MTLQVARKVIEDLEAAFIKASRNSTCLYPNCRNRPIASHLIARKTLKLLADKGHVLTWLTRKLSAWDMMKSVDAGEPLECPYMEPLLVGIKDVKKVTNPLFCQDHDEKIFAPLEKKDFSFHPEQIALLAYRALCSVTFSPSPIDAILHIARQYDYQHSLDTPERLAKLHRFHAVDILLEARQRYEQMHQAQDYSQLGWAMIPVNVQPCIAATYSLIPVDDDDARAIVNGTHVLAAEDVISFSFLPSLPMNNSLCVISWLKGSQRAQRFMHVNRINELTEQEQQDVLLSFTFESPTIYMSPTWWQSLSLEKREEYKKIHFDVGKEHAQLV